MPYKSSKQRGYLHAHPEITDKKGKPLAQKWDKKYGGKVAKAKGELSTLKILGVGTASGALANQFPRIQDIQRNKKKKGQIKKMAAPTSADPDFNQKAAQQAFDLVMKMDDATAEMFTHIVVSDYFEETVEKNLGTLQRHLNETISKQLTDLKRAHLRLVSKGMDDKQAIAYAQAITLLEKQLEPISKINPYDYGYKWKEEDFSRDPSSGRFRTKVSHNQVALLDERTSEAMAIPTVTDHKGQPLSYEDQVHFQDEYRQVANFLGAVRASSGSDGDHSVMMHFRDKDGQDFSQVHTGRTPPKKLLADPSNRLMGIEAKPETLTAGGAAFGLATALGGGMNPHQVKAITDVGTHSGKFSEAWLKSGGQQNSNEKLYGRLASSGEFLSSVGPPGSKTQLAGKFASIVGSAGPQAEAVLGPTARKTAYRYRGTEKAPERRMVRAYAQRVEQGKVHGEASAGEKELEEAGGRIREPKRQGKPGAAPSVHQMVQRRAEATGRAPSWNERELGRQAVVEHLRAKMPQKSLYELQLASGNTPPSEGVIINAEGQLSTQAIGYGDDHYLPFNLKNLKDLKGGEYIRTRSVGGLTSEDIYTALIAGARQVTVTSRSGTYTMTFEPDFRGGRRHSDKARRMTRRYEQLLDAVQSQQVDRMEIDPLMRQEIEREVKEEMSGPQWRRQDIQEAIQERVDEFKENPYITEDDEKRAEAIINARAANASEPERAKIRSQVMDDLMDQKETKFRLNSAGYKAALDALQEQFPYYISKPRWTPPKDAEKKIDTSLDRGYVEPGRNRPTAAAAGLFGAASAQRVKYKGGGKFSASEADYQGARTYKLAPVKEPEEGTAGTTSGRKELEDKRRRAIAESKMDEHLIEVAQELQTHAKGNLDEESLKDPTIAAAVGMSVEELAEPGNRRKFTDWAEKYTNHPEFNDLSMKRKWESAAGHRERKPYDKGSTLYPKQPPTFEEPAYQPGAKARDVAREIMSVDRKAHGSVTQGTLPYSKHSEDELRKEHAALAKMHSNLRDDPTRLSTADLDAIGAVVSSPALHHGKKDLRENPEAILEQMELVQRARALLSGMTDEQRQQVIEQSSRKVETNETPTSQEQAQPRKDIAKEIERGDRVIKELENLRSRANAKLGEEGLTEGHRERLVQALDDLPSEEQTEAAMDALAQWKQNKDILRDAKAFEGFNEEPDQRRGVLALYGAEHLLNTKKEHIEILLNPPKKS